MNYQKLSKRSRNITAMKGHKLLSQRKTVIHQVFEQDFSIPQEQDDTEILRYIEILMQLNLEVY